MAIIEKQPKRHNLQLSDRLYQDLQAMAQQRGESVTSVMRKCLKLGLIALEFDRTGSQLVARRGNVEHVLVIVQD